MRTHSALTCALGGSSSVQLDHPLHRRPRALKNKTVRPSSKRMSAATKPFGPFSATMRAARRASAAVATRQVPSGESIHPTRASTAPPHRIWRSARRGTVPFWVRTKSTPPKLKQFSNGLSSTRLPHRLAANLRSKLLCLSSGFPRHIVWVDWSPSGLGGTPTSRRNGTSGAFRFGPDRRGIRRDPGEEAY
jgi:hypothetical protein